MESLIINFIQKHKEDWAGLLTAKKIEIKYDGDLAIFNYSILADFSDPIVREARGIIIDLRHMNIVCWPFTKFCNYNESYHDNIDWSTARIQDKIDGSLMKLYWYNNHWCIATNGTIDADKANVNGTNYTFGDLFRSAMLDVHLDLSILDCHNTYMFELISPYNRVVCDYGDKITIWHIGTRNNQTGEELIEDIGIHKPNEYSLHSLEDCVATAKKLNVVGNAITKEGFVVVDKDWHRIKVKSPEYVAMHHILPNGEVNDEKLIDYIRNGLADDIITYIPSLATRINDMKMRIATAELEMLDYCKWNKIEVEDNKLSRANWAKHHNKDKWFRFGVKYIFDGVKPTFNDLAAKKIYEVLG